MEYIADNFNKEEQEESNYNYLLSNMDAVVWAKAFVKIFKEKNLEITEDLMRAWFANAIMIGWDHHAWRESRGSDMKKKIAQIKHCMDIQNSDGNWNYNEYMRGYSNGIILSYAIMENLEPEFLKIPEEGYLQDRYQIPLEKQWELTEKGCGTIEDYEVCCNKIDNYPGVYPKEIYNYYSEPSGCIPVVSLQEND